nr:hypothetical protein [Tanacetum cinerariifolium]
MGRDTVQLETAVNTISQEYLLEFTSEYGIPETLHPELPGPKDRIVDFPEGKVGVDEKVFPTVVDWRTSAPKDGMPAESTYSAEAVTALDTHRTPIQKQPEMLLCLVGISRRYYLRDEVYPTFIHDDDRGGLIRAPIPTKLKTGSRPRAAHEVPPPEDVPATSAPEAGQAKEVAATDPSAVTGSRKRGHDGVDANAPLKVLRRDDADPRLPGSTCGGKSLAAIELGMASTRPVPVPESAPADVSDPDPLSFADPRSRHPADGTAAAGDPESENACFASAVGSLESIYRPEWGVANGNMLDTPEACQDLVDHVAPPGYFSELRHLHNDEFLRRYNVNLARQVAMGSQLRLRFEQEAKLLRKSVAQAEADMKKAAEDKNARMTQELKDMCALFSDLQVSNDRLSQQVATLQEQVSVEEKLKVAFEEFKRNEDSRVEQRCAEMDARLDALSIDFDEELYPHMLTAIAGIAKGMSEGLRHGVEHGQAQLTLESIEVYDPEAKTKYIAALQALKDMKYPLVDQLEGLKDAPMDVRDPVSHWACKEEILLVDAIAANVSRAENKKKCCIMRLHRRILISRCPLALQYRLCVLYALWESVRIPNVLGIALRTQSPRPPGLQPVYAADHIAARSRRSSNRFRFRRSSSSLFTTYTAAVRYVGISISVGMTASVPYVRENGVSSWLDLIIVRLRFALSTSPLDCGCLTDVNRCVIFSLSHQSLNGLSLNCFPLSEIISPGIPKRHTILSHTNFFTCPPVIVATAFASIHFVK